jgi:hypothetical protein
METKCGVFAGRLPVFNVIMVGIEREGNVLRCFPLFLSAGRLVPAQHADSQSFGSGGGMSE